MADENTRLETERETEFAEPVYVMAPHPETCVVSNERAVTPGVPEAAEETLSDLIAAQIQNQMNVLRSEMLEEVQSQARRIQDELQADLQTELQREFKGGSEFNVKG